MPLKTMVNPLALMIDSGHLPVAIREDTTSASGRCAARTSPQTPRTHSYAPRHLRRSCQSRFSMTPLDRRDYTHSLTWEVDQLSGAGHCQGPLGENPMPEKTKLLVTGLNGSSVEPCDLKFDIFWATSDNARLFRDNRHAKEVLGYAPQDGVR